MLPIENCIKFSHNLWRDWEEGKVFKPVRFSENRKETDTWALEKTADGIHSKTWLFQESFLNPIATSQDKEE